MPPLTNQALVVVPNPFAVPLSPEGLPCNLPMRDMAETRKTVSYIGAELVKVPPEKAPDPVYSRQAVRVKGRVKYTGEPVAIGDTALHRSLLREGVLLPVDRATAKRARVEFRPPEAVIAAAGKAAAAAWEQERGAPPPVDIWVELGAVTSEVAAEIIPPTPPPPSAVEASIIPPTPPAAPVNDKAEEAPSSAEGA